MSDRSRYQDLSLPQLLAACLFASWHVRRMPRTTPEDRLQRATWCRDHCNTFAGRWYALGAIAWFVQVSPFGGLLMPSGVPVLAFFFLVAFSIGVRHTAWQVVAQEKAGLPPIEEPVDFAKALEIRRRAERSRIAAPQRGRRPRERR